MKKLDFDEILLSLDDAGAYGSEGILVRDPIQGAWIFWPAAGDDGVTYTHDLNETLATITHEYGESVYALNTRYGHATIITDEGKDAGVDTELDLAGYTVTAI